MSLSVTVKVCGDTVYEQNQTFLVNLSNVSEAIISDGQGLGTINNDDAAPVITIDDVTHAEGDSSSINYGFTVTKTGATEVTATVNFATADGGSNGATGGAAPCVSTSGTPDYISQTGSLTFQPADATKSVIVQVCGDSVFELDQTFSVNLSGAVDATIGDPQGLGTITNDDQPPSLVISDVMLNEGNVGPTNFVFTVTKSGLTELSATVDYATAAGPTEPATGASTCGAGVDYESLSDVLTLAPADAAMNITVHVCGELVYEADQTFVVNLSNASNATIADNQALGTIQNDDAPPSLSIADVTLDEGNSGSTSFNFSVTKSGLTELPISVGYSTGGGTASAGGVCGPTGMPDYVMTSGTLSIPAVDPSATIAITVCPESVFELDQTFYVNLSSTPTNATITDGQGLGTIVNDDAPPSFSIGDVTLSEGNSATTSFTFTVTKTGATELDSTVSAATGPGLTEPATAGGSCIAGVDFITLTPTVLTFLAEDTTQSVAVLVCGDTIYERNQTFVVDLSNPVRATIGDGQAIGTIKNEDAAPVITIDDVTQAEGNSLTTSYAFTVTKTGATEVNATVNFATADGTSDGATGGAAPCVSTSGTPDYISQTGSLTFLPAETTQNVTIVGCGDTVFELNQTFFVNLSGAVDATIGDPQGLGTITNDDAPPTLAISDVTAYEGNSGITPFNFTVTKTGLTELNATASYATAPGSINPATPGALCGVAGVDYEIASDTVTLTPADATKGVTVRVCGELVVELDQTFVVNLTNPGYATIADSQGVGAIKNDDLSTTVVLTASPGTINEGASTTINGSFSNVEIGQQQQVDINWGDGSTNTVLTLPAGILSFSSTHQYKDDNPTATAFDVNAIAVTLTTLGPPNFTSGNGTTSVTVNNVAPTVTLNDPGSVFPVNTPITLSAAFTDPGLTDDSYTAVWTFDGVPCPSVTSAVAVTKPNSTPGSVTIGCKFSVPGVYQIVLKVTDDDGGVGTADTIAGVTAQVVIYDPNGGFVTGGGWINSPAGAFPSNPTLIGKANFGFVAKYQKGATMPTGETEFQFHAANLDFHSVSYEWLVVAGARAQYKGAGIIKGMNGVFGFMLTAIDGQVNGGGGIDKFRIKIWGAGGVIVYDNQLGLSDDGDPTTILGGGSIVLHK
jgi:Calx-beta domain